MSEHLEHIMQEIEGAEFRFVANLAGGIRAFKEIVREQKTFESLQEYVGSNADCGQEVLARIYTLASLETDPQYEHPYDTAMAAYLFALEITGSQYSAQAADVLTSVSTLWWAAKIADQVLANNEQRSQTTDVYETAEPDEIPYLYLNNVVKDVKDYIVGAVMLYHSRLLAANSRVLIEQISPRRSSVESSGTATIQHKEYPRQQGIWNNIFASTYTSRSTQVVQLEKVH